MNIKHEVENLITYFDKLQESIIDLGKHLIHLSKWIIGAQEQIRGLKERVEALEKAHYRLEPVPPVTDPTPPPVPSEKDYGWFWPKDQRPEARACFERLLNHSRHCAKHHVLSAEEQKIIWRFLEKNPACLCDESEAVQPIIERLYTVLSKRG